ncbi:MAG: hypothetical protein GXO06_03535, partial [Epsilonproteobacteria bacterium]|nr:hypothetical protein [Campylobacterota bacterium]
MQMVKRLIFGSILSMLFLILFAPKEELYYKLEHELNSNGITISDELFESNLFGISIRDAKIYYKDLYVAKVKSLDLSILYLYDILEIKSVEFAEDISQLDRDLVSKRIDRVEIKFDIFKPYKISLELNSS